MKRLSVKSKIKMSDNIPFEIQEEIMKRLPVKSLIQFRSVSKAWKYLIDSSRFIKHYSGGDRQHLLVSYEDAVDFEQIYVSIADDHTFPHKKVSLTVPQSLDIIDNTRLISSSHGLLCLYGEYPDSDDMVFLWNLCIRKVVAVVLPDVEEEYYESVIGFGVCRETTDPKIVHMTRLLSSNPWRAMVFTLSMGAWRHLHSNRPRESINFGDENHVQVTLNGLHYWLATDDLTLNGLYRCCTLIVAFDMTSEEFIEINLPDSLAHKSGLSMSKLRESLVVLEHDDDDDTVWMMEDGVSKAFTKLFTINYNTSDALHFVLGFRKTGEAIMEDHQGQLVVYEPHSKHINNLGIVAAEDSDFFVHSYIETLLLHDQPNDKVYE